MPRYPALILLHGASSSGKTSIARVLQELLPVAYLNFSVDAVLYGLPPSDLERMMRGEPITREGYDFGHLVRGHHACVAALLTGGHRLVVDTGLAGPNLKADFEWVTRPFDTFRVGVHCDLQTLERRERERGDRALGSAAWEFARVHEEMSYDLEVDTTRATLEACARRVVEAIEDRPRLTGS